VSAASETSGWKKGALLLQRMVENPTVRLHALARGRAEEVKFGRWLRNPSVTVAELAEDCGLRLASQVAGLHVLAIQDTTELNYERHAGRTHGLGTVGNGTDRGLFLHPMLAIEASSKRCLGLVGAEVWTRFECVDVPRRSRAIEDKESHRWLRGAERAKQVLHLAARVTVVADRESDIYEEFARLPGPSFDLLTRAAQDRAIAEGGCLFAYTDRLPIAGRIQFSVSRCAGKREGRIAELELRFGTVTLKRPHHLRQAQACAQVSLRVVDVRETSTVPPGEKPIHWRLLTTHAVPDLARALEIVDWYRQRWHIEQLFWTLKRQGFNLEASQIETAEALMKLAIMATKAATRVMQLVRARDGKDPRPAEDVFSTDEVAVISDLQAELQGRTERQKNPHPPKSLAWAAWTIARLGGWKGYSSSEGPPGPLTMRRGLEAFEKICHGYALARSVHR
jgi:Transposase DDE domain